MNILRLSRSQFGRTAAHWKKEASVEILTKTLSRGKRHKLLVNEVRLPDELKGRIVDKINTAVRRDNSIVNRAFHLTNERNTLFLVNLLKVNFTIMMS